MKRRESKAARRIWDEYVVLMGAARDAANALANTLEVYLRKGVHTNSFRLFDDACRAADAYRGALRRAEPYHFGTMPQWYSGHIINSSEDELIDAMRELRGTAVYHRVTHPDGTSTMEPRYARNGVAGFFELEVAAMKPFGSPRRMPVVLERHRRSSVMN